MFSYSISSTLSHLKLADNLALLQDDLKENSVVAI